MKGKFYESEYEKALIDLLQAEGWQYTNGGNIHRQLREPLLIEDPKVNDFARLFAKSVSRLGR